MTDDAQTDKARDELADAQREHAEAVQERDELEASLSNATDRVGEPHERLEAAKAAMQDATE